MQMALHPGVNTLESTGSKNYTHPNNVWVSNELRQNVTLCDVLPAERLVCTNYLPIATTLDISPTRCELAPHYHWREVNWDELIKEMETELAKLPVPHTLHSIPEFESSLEAFTNALNRVIEKHVQLCKPTPFMKRWWNDDLKQKRKLVRKLARKVYRLVERHNFDHPTHEEHRKLWNEYTQMIRDAKQEHWISWLEKANDQSIWTIHRFILSSAGDRAKTHVPNPKLKHADGTHTVLTENIDKAKALYATFFFSPPLDNGIDPNFQYPPPCTAFQNITDQQIHQAIKRLKPYKGTGPDHHCNSLYIHCCELFVPHLGLYY
jgi:hypothetical protein